LFFWHTPDCPAAEPGTDATDGGCLYVVDCRLLVSEGGKQRPPKNRCIGPAPGSPTKRFCRWDRPLRITGRDGRIRADGQSPGWGIRKRSYSSFASVKGRASQGRAQGGSTANPNVRILRRTTLVRTAILEHREVRPREVPSPDTDSFAVVDPLRSERKPRVSRRPRGDIPGITGIDQCQKNRRAALAIARHHGAHSGIGPGGLAWGVVVDHVHQCTPTKTTPHPNGSAGRYSARITDIRGTNLPL